MVKYNLRIVLPEGRLCELLERITKAQEEIRRSYEELERLGYVQITAAGDEADGRMDHGFVSD